VYIATLMTTIFVAGVYNFNVNFLIFTSSTAPNQEQLQLVDQTFPGQCPQTQVSPPTLITR
jgi:hypothetical protein